MSIPVDPAGAVPGEDDAEDARPAAGVEDGLPPDLLGREEHGPVLLGLLVLGEIFRPDDIVEASDLLFVHGPASMGGQVSGADKSIADGVLGTFLLDDLADALEEEPGVDPDPERLEGDGPGSPGS